MSGLALLGLSFVVFWHNVSIQEALEAHQADVSIKGPSFCQVDPLGQNHDKIIKAFFPLTLKRLHIHLDVVLSPWQLQTDRHSSA